MCITVVVGNLNSSKPKHMKLLKIIITVLILINLSCKNNSEK